jgi:tRNA/tmRNA/rRNA uracil-C5-methylase (TrmA/RlmC/RlmD family)
MKLPESASPNEKLPPEEDPIRDAYNTAISILNRGQVKQIQTQIQTKEGALTLTLFLDSETVLIQTLSSSGDPKEQTSNLSTTIQTLSITREANTITDWRLEVMRGKGKGEDTQFLTGSFSKDEFTKYNASKKKEVLTLIRDIVSYLKLWGRARPARRTEYLT